jgi:hypothetical protein
MEMRSYQRRVTADLVERSVEFAGQLPPKQKGSKAKRQKF